MDPPLIIPNQKPGSDYFFDIEKLASIKAKIPILYI